MTRQMSDSDSSQYPRIEVETSQMESLRVEITFSKLIPTLVRMHVDVVAGAERKIGLG